MTQEMTPKEKMIRKLAGVSASTALDIADHLYLIMDEWPEEMIEPTRRETLAALHKMYPLSLTEILDTEEMQAYISDKLGNELFINDPERADRIQEHAKYGGDGSTHNEVIEDWEEYVSWQDWPDWVKDYINEDIEDCRTWHEDNDSLYEVIG